MSTWQRRARLLVLLFAVAFAIVVALAFRRRAPVPPVVSIARADPEAVVETTSGTTQRFKGAREDVGVDYQQLLSYQDGRTKMLGVRIRSENRADGRNFTVTAKQGESGKDESSLELAGDVRLVASDGFGLRTEHATYQDKDGVVRAPGPVEFGRGRMRGTGLGMTYDKNADVVTVLDQAVVHIAPDERGTDSAEITAGGARFNRRDQRIQFERAVQVLRGGRIIEAEAVTAMLTPDEKHIDALELRGNSRIQASKVVAGGLQALTGRDMDLKYAADGESLERALIVGGAMIQVAGEAGGGGRRISAELLDVALGPDGTTPVSLTGRDNVTVLFPAEAGMGARTIRAKTMEAKGEAGRGLTSAHFADAVDYHETRGGAERSARSAVLDVALKPGMSSIEEARFGRAVRFFDGSMTASAAAARYVLEQGVLELSGSETTNPVPHMANDRITVDAGSIHVTLEGPKVRATGAVKSVLQPVRQGSAAGRMPSMLKQDQPVTVTGETLDYDATRSIAEYTGQAQLWQAETTIRADKLSIDDKRGDLTGTGSVATNVILEQTNKATKAKERVRSVGASQEFQYSDELRRVAYSVAAHLGGPEGEITAEKIELYLKPSGNELQRAEAYTDVTLRETTRKTTGARMTYFADDERYLVTGAPVRIVDECDRETIGRTLTFYKATDTILVDGNQRIRTETKGGGKCAGP